MTELSRVPLVRRDWLFILVCLAILVASIVVIATWFSSAFPEASIDFRYNGTTSKRIAEQLMAAQKFDVARMKHTVVFDSDDTARIFLERTLGLKRANGVMKNEVRVWYFHHRWFRPLQQEEFSVDVAPTGDIVSLTRKIPESTAIRTVDANTARGIAESFLARIGARDLELLSQSERTLPHRVQQIFTWRSRSIHPAAAEYRHTITVDGDTVSSYSQRLKVPEEWLRSYRELRSKNSAAGNVDLIFIGATMIAALAVFISRLRRGDLRVRFLLAVGAVAFILSAGSALNSFPSVVSGYDTTTSYPAFLADFIFRGVLLAGIGTAMLLIVITGAGEVLYRERMPQHLAISRVWNVRALHSKRVFNSLILGYTLVGFFIAYQTIFYVIAEKFGAWAPAEVPYDDALINTWAPWMAILFAGFFPAMSEEFISRAFSIPFFERFFRSRIVAIVLAAYIWGFGHSTYPNQPFYIRGVEVGSAGVIVGVLLHAFGLLPLLIWHFTVDALYTGLMLFRSGSPYYILSAALGSMIFAIPLVASVVLYIRHHGFWPDDDLSNAAIPTIAPKLVEGDETPAALPEPITATRTLAIVCVVALVAAILFIAFRPASPDDVIDYRITKNQAKAIATAHLRALRQPLPAKIAAVQVSGFRSWDPNSAREEGGSPDGFDETTATYMVRHGLPVQSLVDVMRGKIPTATWMVRFFTPVEKTEYFVEVDPRTSRVAGYHKYADERAPGSRLDRNAALAIASQAFARYGVNLADFDVKEALNFEERSRRDWLFHFEERKPLVADAVRRAAVRVMGSEISQFAVTVKVPEAVYRDAHKQTFLNVVLLLVRIAGVIAGLAFVVAGFIIGTRHGRPIWRRAARYTLILAIIPIARALSTTETRLFTYNTTSSWDTFLLNATTDVVRTVGMQIVMLFVAIAGILAIHPYAQKLLSQEGRQRFGRHAVLATLAAIGILISGRELLRIFAHAFPALASVSEISPPDAVTIPAPALIDVAASILGAIVFAGVVTLFATTAKSWKHRWAAPALTMGIIFCVTLDSSSTLRELPMTIFTSAALAGVVWVIARFVLNGNPLAWPLAALTTSLLESGANMLQNHRSDLQAQAWIVFAIAAAVLLWTAWDYRTTSERFFTAHAPGD